LNYARETLVDQILRKSEFSKRTDGGKTRIA